MRSRATAAAIHYLTAEGLIACTGADLDAAAAPLLDAPRVTIYPEATTCHACRRCVREQQARAAC